jgi:hypothetical protein
VTFPRTLAQAGRIATRELRSRDSELADRRSVVTPNRPLRPKLLDVIADLTPPDDTEKAALSYDRGRASVIYVKLPCRDSCSSR